VHLVGFYYKKIPNSSFLRREESCEISAQPMWNADTCPCERMNLTVAQTYDNGDIDKYSCPCVTSGFRREVEGTALLWVITQRVAITPYRRFRTSYRMMRNNPEGRSSHPLRSGNLKPRRCDDLEMNSADNSNYQPTHRPF